MAKKKLVELNEGDLFAIPLFLTDVSPVKSFARDKFEGRGAAFTFLRVIKDMRGGGYFCELFALVDTLDAPVERIIGAPRLCRPLATSGIGVLKKRWKRVGRHEGFDPELHARFSEIQMAIGSYDDRRLWQAGVETPITRAESEQYESWTVLQPQQLERRAVQELRARGLWS